VCQQRSGDWKAYPHLSCNSQWRELMRPNVEQLSEFLEKQRIYLQCPFDGCNMQGAFVDHITSTNGSHFKNLWQKNLPFDDGVPIEELKQRAWEQTNVRGGAVRYNHLDWEIMMWKGVPPPPPDPPGVGQARSPQLSAPYGAPLPIQDANREQQQPFSSARAEVIHCSQLQAVNEWVQIQDAVSVPTSDDGGWQSIPHIFYGKRHWSQTVKSPAAKAARILEAHGYPAYTCSLCPNARGWEEHIPGPKHFDKINECLGETPWPHVREQLWQKWEFQQGVVIFNHLFAEIYMLKKSPHEETPPFPLPPWRTPMGGKMSEPALDDRVSRSPQANCFGGGVLPPPGSPPGAPLGAPPGAPPGALSGTPPGAAACGMAAFLWRQRVPEVASRLKRFFEAVGMSAEHRTCKLCNEAQMGSDVEQHLNSSTHIDNLARTIPVVLGKTPESETKGQHGPRVQMFRGERGAIWFNHMTGEAGLHGSTQLEEPLYEWRCFDYPSHGCYWYNQDTHRYFQVEGLSGKDLGVWIE